jgi:hypothetical protein
MTTGMWEVTITRHDQTKHCYTEQHGQKPRKGDVIETRDATGQTIRARIETYHYEKAKRAGLGIWQVSATEI